MDFLSLEFMVFNKTVITIYISVFLLSVLKLVSKGSVHLLYQNILKGGGPEGLKN